MEVAIGDGFPYAHHFDQVGYEVFGVDIAKYNVDLIEDAIPNINVRLGDAENLDFPSEFFDIVYCFRSTWYFPNLVVAIDEMLRVTKKGGLIMFDVQNMYNPIHQRTIKRNLKREKDHAIVNVSGRFIKNLLKIMLRRINFHSCD